MDNNSKNKEIINSSITVRIGMKREFTFVTKSAKKLSSDINNNRGVLSRKRVTRSQNNEYKKKSFQVPKEEEDKEEIKSDIIDVNIDGDDDEVMMISDKHKAKKVHHEIRQAKRVKVDFSDSDDDDYDDDDDDDVDWDGDNNGVSRKTNRNSIKLKDLFGTGLLEGLPVHYYYYYYAAGGLKGVRRKAAGEEAGGLRGEIRGSGILCFCDECKGSQVLMPNQFQLHAGSDKKRAADCSIYLQNGKSLRDILNACKYASSGGSLEVAIRNAIGFSQPEQSTPCDSLRESEDQSVPSTNDHSCAGPSLPDHASKKSSGKCPRNNKAQGKITKKDLRLHKVVFESNLLADGTPLRYYLKGKQLLSGYKSGSGIFCHCCNEVVSPSVFEAHAGCASRRKPYLQIYTSDGVSLHEWAVAIKRNWQSSTNQSDDVCSICKGVGQLLCCDMCPRAFHQGCVNLPSIPEGTWYCRYCVNMLKREKFVEGNANALAAGRVAGIDPVEEVKKRCIRVIGASERDVGGCVLCRAHDYSESDFGPRTVIICDQCEKQYHVGCLKEHGMDDLQELPTGNWFCSRGCSSIHSALQQLVNDGEQKLSEFLLSKIKKKHGDDASEDNSDLNISWRLLQGKMVSDESRKWLTGAVSVFHERFDPIGDSSESDSDLIPSMIYGRNNGDQDFGGMYCAVLTVNSIVVSAGIFRIFGQDVAEIPLVATSNNCQGKGYFQSLFCCIENLLASVNVRDIVLPAAHEAESMWKNKFGFGKVSVERLKQYKRDLHLMLFLGTSVLSKRVAKLKL